jgi:hypothetical protein
MTLFCPPLDAHCNENPIYVFLFWELCRLSPNFHIHVSVSDLYMGTRHLYWILTGSSFEVYSTVPSCFSNTFINFELAGKALKKDSD